MINITSLGQISEFSDFLNMSGGVPKNLIIKLELSNDEYFHVQKEIQFTIGLINYDKGAVTIINNGILIIYNGIKFEITLKQ